MTGRPTPPSSAGSTEPTAAAPTTPGASTQSFGGKILADDGKCAATATTGVADSYKWLQDLKAAGMKFYQNDNDAKADLLSGKIAGFIDGPWQSGDLSKALGDKLAVAEGPKGTGEWGPMTAPDGFYINASSPNVDLAKGFALQFLQPANEQIFADAGHLPANTTLQPKDPIAQSFSALMPKGFARPTADGAEQLLGQLRERHRRR